MAHRLLQRYKTPLTATGGALLGVVIVLLFLTLNPPAGRYTDADIQRLAQERIDAITPTPPIEPEIYAMIRPAVVVITTDGNGPGESTGVGSGVLVDQNGTILTANHVVADVQKVTVHFFDGTTTSGTVDQRQPDHDLATVIVRDVPDGVQPAVLAGGAQPGDKVMAIGAPFGFSGTWTEGVVSALGRKFQTESGQTLENMIQFDAAVNPGNSGGPLIDMSGHVVGIVSGIYNPTGQHVYIGLSFAVPIESSSGILPPLG